MSRPPRPQFRTTTTGEPVPDLATLDFLPLEHADFVTLQQGLAASELGMVASSEEGDFTRTLLELSAVLGHVLGVYQDRYASEVFLSTAQTARSLVRHGRRLGYEPDPGLAATGYVVLTARASVPPGTVEKGFALASLPLGLKKAQDYETLEDLLVDPALNSLTVANARVPLTLSSSSQQVQVQGVNLGLEPGEIVLLSSATKSLALVVASVKEDPLTGTSTLNFTQNLASLGGLSAGDFVLRAKPDARFQLFGWNASPVEYPATPTDVLTLGAWVDPASVQSPTYPAYGYVVSALSPSDLFLVPPAEQSLVGQEVVRVSGSLVTAYRIGSERALSVAFMKETTPVTSIVVTGWNSSTNTPTTTTSTVRMQSTLSGPATAISASVPGGGPITRSSQDIRGSAWLTLWRDAWPLVADAPSSAAVTTTVTLEGAFTSLVPGMKLLLSTLDEGVRAVVSLTAVEVVPASEEGEGGEKAVPSVSAGTTTLTWTVLQTSDPDHAWTLGDLVLRGNVVACSHGKSVVEVLGDSDGITPFLRFELKNLPLTHLPGASGAEPALELRVGGVLWERVTDFYDSGPEDRHTLVQRDETRATFVLFGDGRHGSIPPSGKKHLQVRYRVGLGPDGNADVGQVSRIKKASPLVERAVNPLAISGGTAPAEAEDVRTQATRYIRTFDRAVSVQDYADLSLLYAGVARATATWTELEPGGPEGVLLVVASADGQALSPVVREGLRAFLDARRDLTVPLKLADPQVVEISVQVYLDFDPAFLEELVKTAARDALFGTDEAAPGLLTFAARGLGQPLFLSELYEALVAVEGVLRVEVQRMSLLAEGPIKVYDAIRVDPNQWLHLSAQNFEISATPEDV